ncbi:MAG: RnfABCDGE type electron transport complex subunit G [Oscillospiraceae bacterium]|nr:RnfABCDGE type electron transport complex subunit G [Oscillospiraceae bacterium]
MNKILKLTFILFLICAITAGILGVVNEVTKDRIYAINNAATIAAYSAVLEAEAYEEQEFDGAAFSTVDKVSEAANGSGYVVELTVSGAQGLITLAVGVDNDYKCTGISIITHSETSGLGANAAADSEIGRNFRAQFVGEGEDIALSKSGGNIDALAGATITSNAVTGAVATAIQVVKSLG